jgi:hypothetical protein
LTTDLVTLALDPGTSTGWAASTGGAGAIDFGRPKPKAATEAAWHGLVGQRFEHWLDGALSRTGAGVLAVERQMTHGKSGHLLLGLRMIALVRGRCRGLCVEEVWSASWQPWARRELDWQKGGDEADARAILAYFEAVRLPRLVA